MRKSLRLFLVAAVVIFGVVSSSAIPIGPNSPQGSGSGPPLPTCSQSLDFGQACNSQYIFLLAEPFE